MYQNKTNKKGKRFHNPWNPRNTGFLDFLRWRFTAKRKYWPKKIQLKEIVKPLARVEGNEIHATFIGHATVLIQTQGLNILTDPIWSKKTGPFGMGVKRVVDPGIPFDLLPKIDLVLVTHGHYDHLDQPTLKRLRKRDNPHIIIPMGNEKYVKGAETLDWTQSTQYGPLRITLEPVQHWSNRSLWDINKGLWGSFVIESPAGNFYLSGDTGYAKGLPFKHAKEKYGDFKFALLPIGAYEPRWFMEYVHMNPEDAVKAHCDLGRPFTLGIHYGTFRLTDEGYNDPLIDLSKAREKFQVTEQRFRTLDIGKKWIISDK